MSEFIAEFNRHLVTKAQLAELRERLRLHAQDLVTGGTNASQLRADLKAAATVLEEPGPTAVPPLGDDDLPLALRQELMECAVSNGRINYWWLCNLFRRGRQEGAKHRAFVVALINAIGDVSKTEALDVLDREWPSQ